MEFLLLQEKAKKELKAKLQRLVKGRMPRSSNFQVPSMMQKSRRPILRCRTLAGKARNAAQELASFKGNEAMGYACVGHAHFKLH